VAIDDFDDGYGDPSDYGMSQQDFDDASAIGQATYSGDSDQLAQAIANSTARARSGSPSRSNVTGMANYDPQFAAALKISRGLNPGVNTGGLDVPSYLQPQLPGNKVLNEAGDRTMYYSPVERFMQEDLADIAQSGIGLTGLVGRGLDALLSGIDFLSNSKAGDTVEKLITETTTNPLTQFDQFGNAYSPIEGELSGKPTESLSDLQGRRNKIEEMQQNASEAAQLREQGTDPNFIPNTFPTIDRTNVLNNSFMNSGASLATDPNLSSDYVSRMRAIDALSPYQKRGIVDLPEARPFSEIINNTEIDAGENKGQNLYDGSQYNDLAMQKLKNLGYNVEVPNLPSQFPTSRPFPGTNEVALQRGTDGYYFANASNRKLDIPERISNFTFPTLTEAQVRASDDAGYSFEPTTNLATLGLQRDNTEFIEKANLPPELQGIVGLNTDLDYGQTTPLSVLLENTPLAVTARNRALKKEQEKKDKEIAEAEAFRKFRASLSPSTRIGGGYEGVNEPVRPNYSSSFTPSLPPLY